MMRNPHDQVTGPDGVVRRESAEARLDALVEATFTTDTGRQVLDYLKSITVNRVLSAQHTDAELRFLEGQRHLVGLLQTRIENYAQRRKAHAAQPATKE